MLDFALFFSNLLSIDREGRPRASGAEVVEGGGIDPSVDCTFDVIVRTSSVCRDMI